MIGLALLEWRVRAVKGTFMFSFCHQVIVPLPSFEAGTRRPLTKGARAQERVRSGCVSLLHRLIQCAVLEFCACSWGGGGVVCCFSHVFCDSVVQSLYSLYTFGDVWEN